MRIGAQKGSTGYRFVADISGRRQCKVSHSTRACGALAIQHVFSTAFRFLSLSLSLFQRVYG